METATLTAEDVAVELVATKHAILRMCWHINNTTAEPPGMLEWADETPVPLDEDAYARAHALADTIEMRMLAAVGRFISRRLLPHVA